MFNNAICMPILLGKLQCRESELKGFRGLTPSNSPTLQLHSTHPIYKEELD
jgi:hypothetical protein